MNLLIIAIILILINLINSDSDWHGPNFGECGKVGYKAKDFHSCKDKGPYDDTLYCCFLKSGKDQQCVEIKKVDIDDGAVGMTILEIEKGIYEPWEDNEGFKLNKIYEKLDDLICDKSLYLQLKKISLFLFIIFLFY